MNNITALPLDLQNRLYLFLNSHEKACLEGVPCPICAKYIHLKVLDQDIDANLIKNYCKTDKELIDQIPLKKLTSKTQRIHVIGNVWGIINSLKHRKFTFFCKNIQNKQTNKDSICITDITDPTDVIKIDNKMIITQGYSKEYNLTSVDFLLVEKKYIDDSFGINFDIPEKGFLVVDLSSNEKFYTI